MLGKVLLLVKKWDKKTISLKAVDLDICLVVGDKQKLTYILFPFDVNEIVHCVLASLEVACYEKINKTMVRLSKIFVT